MLKYLFPFLVSFVFYSKQARLLAKSVSIKTILSSFKMNKFEPSMTSNSIDSLAHSKKDSSSMIIKMIRSFNTDFFTSVTGMHYLNASNHARKNNNVSFYYSATLNKRIKTKYLSVNLFVFNEFGYRKYFDSIGVKLEDNYAYKVDLSSSIHKQFNFQFSQQVRSQLWKSWTYENNGGSHMSKKLFSSYFSPGYMLFSLGISYNFWTTSKVELGLLGTEIVKIKNTNLFETRMTNELYGIKKGSNKRINVGICANIQIPSKKLGKNIYWDNNSRLFINGAKWKNPETYNIEVNNGVHILFLTYLRLGLRTKIAYDNTISNKALINNMLLLGFYLKNNL